MAVGRLQLAALHFQLPERGREQPPLPQGSRGDTGEGDAPEQQDGDEGEPQRALLREGVGGLAFDAAQGLDRHHAPARLAGRGDRRGGQERRRSGDRIAKLSRQLRAGAQLPHDGIAPEVEAPRRR